MEKQCAYCGTVFRSSHKGARFCCREHSTLNQKGKLRKERPTLICQYCGKEFTTYLSEIRKGGGIYCCREHHDLSRIGKPIPKEICEKRSKKLKGRIFSEEHIKKLSEAAKRVMNTPERKAKQAEIASKRFKGKLGTWAGKHLSKAHKEKLSIALSKRILTDDHKKKISESIKGIEHDEEWIMREIESKTGGFWYGNIRYYYGPQYCEKWNENLRERVRAFFGYKCFECGIEQNGKRLHVHHVWYNKKLCCDDTPRSLVPLCNSCHSKTLHDRDYWSHHLQEILDERFDGRCWMTKYEYAAYKLHNH